MLDARRWYRDKVPKSKTPETFVDRLRQACAINGVSTERKLWAQALAIFIDRRCKTLGIESQAKSRQTIHNWIADKPPKPEGYAFLTDIFGVNCYWLITGKGDIRRGFRLKGDQQEAMQILESLEKANPKLAHRWLSDGRSLMELFAQADAANPFGKRQ